MALKPDPNLMKAIKIEIEKHIKDHAIARTEGSESADIHKKIREIESNLKSLEALNKQPMTVGAEAMNKGASGKVALAATRLQGIHIKPEIEEAKKHLEAEKNALLKEMVAAQERHANFLKEKQKALTEGIKAELGVSDVKVLKSKVATLEKIVKALVTASKAGVKGDESGGVAAAELHELQNKFKEQEKKLEEFAKMKDEMLKEVTQIETIRSKEGIREGEKVVVGEPLDPAKMKVVESNLKRLESEKKLLEDSIKVVQSKQESRKKEIEDAIAAAEAKREKEREKREMLLAEKMKNEQEAIIKKAMETLLEARLTAIEARLSAQGG